MALSVSFRRVLALAIAVLTVSLVVDATQVMHRPDNYQDAPRKVQTGNVTPQIVHKRSPGMVQAAYSCLAVSRREEYVHPNSQPKVHQEPHNTFLLLCRVNRESLNPRLPRNKDRRSRAAASSAHV